MHHRFTSTNAAKKFVKIVASDQSGSNSSADQSVLAGVTVIKSEDAAAAALAKLLDVAASDPERMFACDTEVMDIDVKSQSAVGNGIVTCASVYCGPDIDFGSGSCLWIDNLDDSEGLLEYFRPFWTSTKIKKCWHNYGFDRHVLYNHGIDCLGLGADTIHMARLWDSARKTRGGYSLETLSKGLLTRHQHKRSMTELFSVPVIKKDGTPGKQTTLPPVEMLQRDTTTRDQWIKYSAMDALCTWELYQFLKEKLKDMRWDGDGTLSMLDFYLEYLVPFAECLTDMERHGIKVDMGHLRRIEAQAETERTVSEEEFKAWASAFCSDVRDLNPRSTAQIQQLLFAPCRNQKRPEEALDRTRVFKVPNTSGFIAPGKTSPLKQRDISITGIGIPPTTHTPSGWPAASAPVLRELCGDPKNELSPKFGSAMRFFQREYAGDRERGAEEGRRACEALDSLCRMSQIETLLSTFIRPLQQMGDPQDRIHCSLNINTETGRLSARRPNLQNQPALEKDIYRIRQAFTCEPGNTLIVADYGQLELRLLAHMTSCQSMLTAFEAGGDFHSRTALGMYPHVRDAVTRGECLLEWDFSDGSQPPVPLLKDQFASERRRAKVLNFSIAYGMTPHGLAKQWDTTTTEAKETLERWHEDRPEVRAWQKRVIAQARRTEYTRTLMGRYRHLPDINKGSYAARGHSERAAINTPIQGGAADVVMKAMLKLWTSEVLKEHGWRLLLQIHDEVILEGPTETSDVAMAEVVQCMEHPFERDLQVALTVDAKMADTWFEAK